jgi:RNA-directed DNA polymerase
VYDADLQSYFPGYTFRCDRDRQGRGHRYLNWFPSKKSVRRERDKLRELTGPGKCLMPIPALIHRVNEQARGRGAYSRPGYPRKAFRSANAFVRDRLTRHLKRRGQRPFRPPEGVSWYEQPHRLGLEPL